MKFYIILLLFILFVLNSIVFSEQKPLLTQTDLIIIPMEYKTKIASGFLVRNISEKKYLFKKGLVGDDIENAMVYLYFSVYPASNIIENLEEMGIDCYLETWTPPLDNHPYGFFLAKLPVEKFLDILNVSSLKRIDSAEYKYYPKNNRAYKAINADDVWTSGWDGTGVKVAVLDSGLDSFYDGTDMPSSYDKKDYSAYPTLDDNVENTHLRTGHGTHVSGSVLGRGSLSASNTGNGGGAYKGIAPDADLCFLKIENDASGGASNAAINGALTAAVNTYNSDIITMSYGGWSTYHDGSDDMCQTADWCYDQGVPVFMSAGNDANDDHHYSGTVNAGSETGYIQVNTNFNSALTFNLVWYDGLDIDNVLDLKYYDSGYNQLANVTDMGIFESIRGTESRFSHYNFTVGAGTYYLKVVNSSFNSQFFHIYFDNWGYADITFQIPDPFYTCGSPAEADNVFAVGAWTTDRSWTAYNGSGPYFPSETNNDICSFSNRGPRIDGIQKPQLTAPGASVISIRDTDVYTSANAYWVDNNGDTTASHNYYVMLGTSMSCPMMAGAAALILDRWPNVSPQQVYDALQNNALVDGFTGGVPNDTWGYGKLDVLTAINDAVTLPVILSTLTVQYLNNVPTLYWVTRSESDNIGWFIYRNIEEDFGTATKVNNNLIPGYGTTSEQHSYIYEDEIENAMPGDLYWYWLESIDLGGEIHHYDKVGMLVIPPDYEPEPGQDIQTQYGLHPSLPNPFGEGSSSTKVSFMIHNTANTDLKIYNIRGELIRSLYNGVAYGDIEVNDIIWDGKDEYGIKQSTGIYLLQLNVNGKPSETKKVILLR
ncbi:MAG: S8 family peptidase [Candidatus Cloacimonetes bacterium]|nr:S8 family peptidase [Candidatus Cloacimonadota bacterium]